MIENRVIIGSLQNPSYEFDNSLIHGGMTVTQSVALVGDELTIDKFTPIVSDTEENLQDVTRFVSSDGFEIFTQDNYVYVVDVEENAHVSGLIDLPAGTPVWYYSNYELVGKFYVDSVTRDGTNKFSIECVSAIGLLDKMYSGGGMFSTTTFGAVLQQILATSIFGTGSPVIDYSIDDDVAALNFSGYIPYGTKRELIHKMIFSYGVNILKDANGNPRFSFIHTSPESAEEIPIEKIYDIGNVEYSRPYSKVSVLEHTYLGDTTEDEVTLFDNTEGTSAVSEQVVFSSSPIILSTLNATGTLVVSSSNVNAAIVSGVGKLTGVPYTHTTRSVSKVNALGDTERTANVDNCTLVNSANSQNLLNRLYAFYCPGTHIKKVTDKIVYDNQRCGHHYQITNKYGEEETALLAKMDITASSFLAADCEWYSGYVPAGQTGLYQHVMILDKDTYAEDGGVFTLPEGVTSIKVVMIGGGTGGSSGYPGYNGDDAYVYTNVTGDENYSVNECGAEGGEGGDGGTGGAAGRVKSVVIDNPSATYSYTIGSGGNGGNAVGYRKDTIAELRAALENENPGTTYTDSQIQTMIDSESGAWSGSVNAGSAGTASTFGSYSTADQDAYVPLGGVYDPINGNYYALTGKQGVKGGKGGAREVDGIWYTNGEDITFGGVTYQGGTTGTRLSTVSGLPEAIINAPGGNGAGAAVGLGRSDHAHMDGDSSQTTSWEVTTD